MNGFTLFQGLWGAGCLVAFVETGDALWLGGTFLSCFFALMGVLSE